VVETVTNEQDRGASRAHEHIDCAFEVCVEDASEVDGVVARRIACAVESVAAIGAVEPGAAAERAGVVRIVGWEMQSQPHGLSMAVEPAAAEFERRAQERSEEKRKVVEEVGLAVGRRS